MRILYTDSRSILPRADSLHLAARLCVVLALLGYILFAVGWPKLITPLGIVAGIEVLLLGIGWYLIQCKNPWVLTGHFYIVVLDIFLITAVTYYTGGILSDFYLYFILLVTMAAYLMTTGMTIIYTGVLSVVYIGANTATLTHTNPVNLVLRLIIIWFFSMAVNYVAEHTRRSEKRLLGLFNTLNKRTSELEKMHAQLEMVYDNSRTLAGILDFDQIIQEVLKIGERVMDYPALGIMLIGPNDSLIYRGRLTGGRKNTHLKAVPQNVMDLAYRVARDGEPVTVIDISSRTDFQPLLKSARSVMLVPMVTYGKTMGLLTAESPRKGIFSEQDEKFLAVLARSAAMALENAVLHRKTEELTVIDDLTGVHNFRYFKAKIGEERKRAARYNQPLSLIMLDIDWFKRFNDNYGHEFGNQVLVGLVSVVKRCIRDVDILCRYGGEEFIVILPNTTERETHRIAERIRLEVESTEFGGGGNIPVLKVTVSVGVSSFPENGLPEEELVNAVDQAMYQAKGSGKNTVCTV